MITTGAGALLSPPRLEEFADRFREWMAVHDGELAPLLAPRVDCDERVVQARGLRRLLSEHGWGRCGWPESVGGLGGTIVHRGIVYEELFRVGWTGPMIFEHLEIIAPTLVRFAEPGFAAQVLPAFINGSLVWAQGFSEPEAGSDLASLRTQAAADGEEFVVTGSKIWTSWAKWADWCLALVRTGTAEQRHRGLTMIAVDLRAPGVDTRPVRQANGTDELAEVTFDRVRVPRSQVVGEVGGGWQVAMFLLARERGTLSWLKHCEFRQQLLASAKSMRETHDRELGTIALQLAGVRAAAANLLWRDAAGAHLGADSAFNKLLMTRTEQNLNNLLLDAEGIRIALPGPADEDILLQQDYLFSRIVTLYGGSQQMQLSTIARHVLGLPHD